MHFAFDVPTIFSAVIVILLVLTGIDVMRARRITIAARAWLLVAGIMGLVLLWLNHVHTTRHY
jgi:hypothetical protein